MDSYPPDERECYQVTTAPGTPIEDPYEAIFDASITQDGEINFAPVAAEVKTMEWLYLAAKVIDVPILTSRKHLLKCAGLFLNVILKWPIHY